MAGASDHERSPLLGGTLTEDDSGTLDQQVKTRRRWGWVPWAIGGILIVVFVVIIVVEGVLSRRGRNNHNSPEMNSSLCITPVCIHAASEILYNLSPDYQFIDPCTNFDALVCEGFDARHDIPSDRSSYSTSSIMAERGQTILRHILEGPYPTTSEHSLFSPQNLGALLVSVDEENFLKMQTAYNSCMDESDLAKLGAAPLSHLVDRLADTFPVEDGHYVPIAEADYANLSSTILLLHQHGVPTFEYLTADADDKNPDVVIIQAYPGGLSLPSVEHYEKNETLQTFETMLTAVFHDLLPTNSSRAEAHRLAQTVVELEQKIASVMPPPEDLQDVTKYYNIMKVEEAGKLGGPIGLATVIRSLVPESYVNNNMTMMLAFPEFLGNISDIISSTPKPTLQSFLIWKAIYAFADAVVAPQVEPILRFGNELAGRDPATKPERYKTCLNFVDHSLGWILSRFYVEATFSDRAKVYGDNIIKEIKAEFITKLNNLSWMDDNVNRLAINKVNNIVQKIGYPTRSPDIMRPEALRDYYADLEITDSFFNNSIATDNWLVKQMWSQLTRPVDRGDWGMTADVVNAYYSPVGNEIVFPAAILQFPVFSVDLPGYVSYGSFASVAGHELTHAFDSSGRHYDENGRYTDWWTNNTVEEFNKRADCFVQQYGNFTIESEDKTSHVNGRLTLGENIADAGGVSAAFSAWKNGLQESVTPEPDLPGLEFFTHEQLFFIFYANFWCGKIRQEEAINRLHTDPHSPAFARILGTMANSKDFREAFSCPVKEPTCKLW